MAYGREREWDHGKGAYGGGGHVRPREDDEYGGSSNKRHKYNNNDYDEGYVEEYSYDDRRRDQGPRRKLVPSEPSQHVIFLGLDQDYTEADLQTYLLGLGCVLNSVTIIRDRATGLSKGFGFAEFASVEHASVFLTPRFPFIDVPPPAAHGTAAYYAWQVAAEAGTLPPNQRRVKIDFSQSPPPGRPGAATVRGPIQINDGTRDIGTTAAPVLLFRGLDPISAPEAVAAAVRQSAGLGKDAGQGMRRVLLIKDKMTKASWGFAFVEFVDVQSASAVLANSMSQQLHPEGFKISDRPVAASFAHPYSWQKVPDNVIKDEACVESTVALGGVDGEWARYWDDSSTLSILEFDVQLPGPSKPQIGPVKEQKPKKKEAQPKNVDAEVAAFLGSMADEFTAAAAMPVLDKPLTLSFSKPVAIGAKTANLVTPSAQPVRAPALGFAADESEEIEGSTEDAEQVAEDTRPAAAKKVGPLIASKKVCPPTAGPTCSRIAVTNFVPQVANNISRWNTVQSELNPGGKPTDAIISNNATSSAPALATPPKALPPKAQPKKASPSGAPATTSSSSGSDEFEYSDPATFACFLCSRALKTLDQLKRHNTESDLHKKNLKDSSLRDVARGKADAARAKRAGEQTTKYRDRALERRAIYGQPDVPAADKAAGSAASKKRADGPPPLPSPPPPPLAPAKDENNIGNKLLKMMGWSEGTGLGVEGDGRVDPIETAMYETGAGIGASKGKEVGKYSGYSGYVAMAKDNVRDRYNDGT
ncbi:hypothetical protein EXIGLDRAFT_845302 [Exidia glandulosa HHB12029]|uniref:G-patch domain-containing protein n=1 Tax=Exidia glandulosa HHB12029 TaxID=1314781 RepID=A0A165BIY7_EXIGL|nr:hypothetical protein EXIGLDRAFT_845302 [Exidia glandulosa HHB12029]